MGMVKKAKVRYKYCSTENSTHPLKIKDIFRNNLWDENSNTTINTVIQFVPMFSRVLKIALT